MNKQEWKDFIKNPIKNKVTTLDLSEQNFSRLKTLPKEIGDLEHLEELNLKNCHFKGFPPEITQLKKLRKLIFTFYTNVSLKFIGKLHLTYIEMHNCDARNTSLQKLDKMFAGLTQLTHINLSDYWLKRLPKIEHLEKLTTLELPGTGIYKFPTVLQELPNLTVLDISSNRFSSFAGLEKLKQLKVLSIFFEKNFPREITDALTNLEALSIQSNDLLKLPKKIGNLKKLAILKLPRTLQELPKEIGNLVELKELDLRSFCALSNIPKEIGNLTKLTSLNLEGTYKLRTLPEEISNLTNLEFLQLARSGFTNLPENIGNLTKLTSLELTSEHLKELPKSIGNLKNLKRLIVKSRHIKSIPETIGGLKNLNQLVLRNCSIEELPSSIGNLCNLVILQLEGNKLQRLPKEIGKLVSLHFANFYNNQLEELPQEICSLTQLIELNLADNKLQTLPVDIGNLINIKTFAVWRNQLTELPEKIGNFVELQELDVSRNRLRTLPQSVGNLVKLKTLCVQNNKLEELPTTIGKLKKIDFLGASINCLAKLPMEIGKLDKLKTLSLERNNLIKIPPEIEELYNLTTLKLNHNKLTSLPDSIKDLSQLRYLELDDNKLNKLPQLENLSKLIHLSIQHNALTYLPTFIEKLTSLEFLNANHNKIETLPVEICHLTNLATLYLIGNKLTSLPKEFNKLKKLRKLNLTQNALDASEQMLTSPEKLFASWEVFQGSEKQSQPKEIVLQKTITICLCTYKKTLEYEKDYFCKYIFPGLAFWCQKWELEVLLKHIEVSSPEEIKEEKDTIFLCLFSKDTIKPLGVQNSLVYLAPNDPIEDILEHKIYLDIANKPIAHSFKDLGDIILDASKKMISNCFQENLQKIWQKSDNPWHLEQTLQSQILKEHTKNFMDRKDLLQKLQNYVDMEGLKKPFLLHGASGTGKTALLARFYQTLQQNKDVFPIVHFVGASPYSANLALLIHKIRCILKPGLKQETYKYFTPYNSAFPSKEDVQNLAKLLSFKSKKVVLIIDGCERLDGNHFDWLPKILPPRAKVIISHTKNKLGVSFSRTLKLENFEKKEVAQFCKQYGIQSLGISSSPLFLHMLRGKKHIPQELEQCFSEFILELEEEHGAIVTTLLSLLYCSKEGLTHTQLKEITGGIDEENMSQMILWRLQKYLYYKNGKLKLIPLFANAIAQEYQSQLKMGYKLLADYFQQQPMSTQGKVNEGKLREQIHQEIFSDFHQAVQTITDFKFLNNKLRSDLHWELKQEAEIILEQFATNSSKMEEMSKEDFLLYKICIDISFKEMKISIQELYQSLKKAILDFDYIEQKTYSCAGVTNKIHRFEHKKSKMPFVLVPGGHFIMGEHNKWPSYQSHTALFCAPPRKIEVYPFFISQCLLRKSVWNGKPYNKRQYSLADIDHWTKADEFCNKLGLALPTEAQWEYACRGGSVGTQYFWGNNTDYKYLYGQSNSNAFGIYELVGYAWQWCADYWHSNYKGAPADDRPWLEQESELPYDIDFKRVVRGGDNYSRNAVHSCAHREPERKGMRMAIRIAKSIIDWKTYE